MEKKRIALIGAFQAHADKFVNLINSYEESEMAAVWTEDPQTTQEYAEMAHCPGVETWEEIMADESIDGVIIMSAPIVHAKHVIAAANAGKHVYVEKALCITDEEAEQIRKAVKESGIILAMADPIITPITKYFKQKIEEGALGPIVNAKSRVSFEQCPGDKKYDPDVIGRIHDLGGIIADTHSQHILLYLLGKPVRAAAMMSKDPSGQTDIDTVCLYEFANGTIGISECCARTASAGWLLEVHGEKGSLITDRKAGIFYCPAGGTFERVPDEELPEPEDYPLHYWISCVQKNIQNELYGVDDACDMIAMQNAARAAAENSVMINR